ncbi:MAG: threonine synthase, partial [Kiritimatiellia bacterium]
MKFISTRNPTAPGVDLKEAVLRGLPPDNGLYLPETIGRLPDGWLDGLADRSFPEIAQDVAQALLGDSITPADLHAIIARSLTFDAPLHRLDEDTSVLELFHGPTLAFKDFGARFMAAMMGWMVRDDDRGLTVLVATSGDTGGAVAAGFHQVPGIRVVVLYPSGRVSPLQEKQLTTLGANITALEVAGSFDDCQALVKAAFLDPALAGHLRLTSANSISLARLIPQAFYYFRAFQQAGDGLTPVVFSVPSGNFGNLTAGLLAKRIGLPVARFLAATNANDEVPEYLESGVFTPRPSIATISNAMDVGNPSNFARMLHLYGGDVKAMRRDIAGAAFSDS